MNVMTPTADPIEAINRIETGFNAMGVYRDEGMTPLSGLAACIAPLLNALGWTGAPRHLAEALPHFIDDIDVDEARRTLANLNYAAHPVKTKINEINPSLLPCIFIPTKGPALVAIEWRDDGLYCFDGGSRTYETITAPRQSGTALILNQVDIEAREQRRRAKSWLFDIFSYFRPLAWRVLLVTAGFNILSIATPIFMMTLYDRVIPSGSVIQLLHLFGGIAIAIALETAFRQLRVKAMAHLAGRIDYLVGRAVLERILHLPLGMTEAEPLGTQLAHLQEFETIREIFSGSVGEAFLDMPFVLLFLAAIAAVGGWVVLIPVAGILAFVLLGFIMERWSNAMVTTAQNHKGNLQRFTLEMVAGMRSIKFAGAEEVWMQRFRDVTSAAAMQEHKIAQHANVSQVGSKTIVTACGIAMLGFGTMLVMDDAMSIGGLIAASALLWRVLTPMQSAFLTVGKIVQIRSSVARMNQLMRLNGERIPGVIPFQRELKGNIDFRGVAHRYRPDAEPALNGINLSIKSGELIAITGPNGAGKTTIINLLIGLYRHTMGTILIDGVDIRQIDPIELRQRIGLAPQNCELFYGTVAQNLRLSNPTATNDDVKAAISLAGMSAAVEGLPEGIDTRLNERLLDELPAGFSQRLSLARTYLRKSPLMIFDEAAQSLDEEGDRAFMNALRKLRGHSTIIIVTHRPSHMKLADRLIVVERGQIRFDGPPPDHIGDTGESPS